MKNNHLGRNSVFALTIAFTLILLQSNLVFAAGSTTNALPQGGSSPTGNVTYNYSGNTLNQNSTGNSISNFSGGINVGSASVWNINQPSASSVSLNRDISGNASSILGTINSNGRVFLVNTDGILFGRGAQVNALGLVASTLDISDSDFLAGKYNFKQNGKNAWIINKGNIHITNGGYVVLLSDALANSGVIEAPLGHILLASGQSATVMGLDDDSDISVTIDDAIANGVFGPKGLQMTNAINNTGTIQADGGTILLTAKILNGIFDNAINNTGVVQANSLVNNNGNIEIVAVGGGINSTGSLNTTGAMTLTSDSAISSQGTLNASSLIESGSTFQVGGVFNPGVADISNADGFSTFTANTDITGNLSDTNFEVDPNVILTETGNTSFTATTGSFIMDANSAIDGNGFNLSITAATDSSLGNLNNIGSLTLNGSAPMTFSANGNIVASTLTIGSNVTLGVFSVPASGVDVGVTDTGTDPVGANFMVFDKYTTTVPLTITGFGGNGTAGGNIIVGIYTNAASNVPGSLIANTSAQGPLNVGSSTISLTNGATLPAGTYWIGFNIDTAQGITDTSTPGITRYYEPSAFSAGLEPTVNPAGLVLAGANSPDSIYFVGKPAATIDLATSLTNNGTLALSYAGITAANKIYDTTSTATLSGGSLDADIEIAGDLLTLDTSSATGTFNSENVGTTNTVTVSGLGLSGPSVGLYTLSPDSVISADIWPGTPSYLGITGTGTQTAGDSQDITISAYDQYGNIDSTGPNTYFGAKSLTFSGASNSPNNTVPTVTGDASTVVQFNNPATITFTAGAATSSMVLYKAESPTIDVTDSSISSSGGHGLSLTVNPGALSSFTLADSGSGTEVAGTPFSVSATAYDAYGNVDTLYNGTEDVSFSSTATASPNSTSPVLATGNQSFTSGTATVGGFTLYNASETPTITINDVGGATGTTSAITVNPAVPYEEIVTATTDDLTLATYDQYGNQTGAPVTGAPNVPGSSDLTNLIIDLTSTNTATVGGGISLTGALTVDLGSTLNPSTFTISGSTLDVFGTLLVNTPTFAGNYAFSGARTLESGSTVNYAGVGQTIDSTLAYYNLITSGSGDATIDGPTSVGGDLTVGSGTDLNGTYDLTVAGNAVLNGTVGGDNAPLANLTIDGTTNINTSSITTTGNQTYNGAVTLGTNATLTSAAGSSVINVGDTDTNGTGAVGSDFIVFDEYTTTQPLTITGFGAYGTAGGNVIVGIYTDAGGAPGTLVANSSTQGALNVGTSTIPLTSSIVLPAGTYWIGFDIDTPNAVTTSTAAGSVRFYTPSAFGSGLPTSNPGGLSASAPNTPDSIYFVGTPAGAGINFNSTLDSSAVASPSDYNNLTISAVTNATFNGAVGSNAALGSLNVTAPAIDINGGSVTTVGDQTYNGAVTLGKNTTLTSNSASTTINIGDTATNGTGPVGNDFVVFDQYTTTIPITVTAIGAYGTAGGNAYVGIYSDASGVPGALIVTSTETPLAVGTNAITIPTTTLAPGTYWIGFNIDTPQGITTSTVPGVVRYYEPAAFTAGLPSSAPSGLTLGAANTPDSTYIIGTPAGGAVNFSSTVDSSAVASPSDYNTLTIAAAGDVNFGGAVGSNAALGSLSVTGASIDINGGSVTTNGEQSYNGPVTLTADTTLTTTGITSGPGITFNGTVDSNGDVVLPFFLTKNRSLTISDSGETTFNDAVGGTFALGSLDVTAPAIDINGGSVTTDSSKTETGDQTYNGPVTLGANTTLTTNSAVDGIAFNGTVDSSDVTTPGTSDLNALTIADSATTTFNDAVGGTFALGGLDVTAKAININGGSVTTTGNTTPTGDQTYNGPVTLGVNTTLTTNTVVDGITFNGTVDSSDILIPTISDYNSLTINDSGTTTFGGAVGSNFALGTLDVTAAGIDINGSSVATVGTQTYNGPVTLGADTTLTSAAAKSEIDIGNTSINGANADGTNYLVFDEYTTTIPITITQIETYGTAGGNAYVGVYNNAGGAPGSLIVSNNSVAGGSSLNAGGTTGITIPSTTLAPGTYWIAFNTTNSGTNSAITGQTGVTGGIQYYQSTPYTTLPGTVTGFGGFTAKPGVQDEIYLIGSPAGGAVNFNSTVDSSSGKSGSNNNTLTISAVTNATFGGAVGSNAALGTVDVTAPVININGGSVATNGDQTYTGNVAISAVDTTLTTNSNSVDFSGTVTGSGNALTIGAAAVTVPTSVPADLSDVTFSDAVSGLSTLYVYGTSAINGGSVATNGDQTYAGNVTIGAVDTTLTTNSNNVNFGGTVTGSGDALTIGVAAVPGTPGSPGSPGTLGTPGLLPGDPGYAPPTPPTPAIPGTPGIPGDASNATFGGVVSNLGSLYVYGTSAINGGSVTTTNEQTYNGAVTLGANTTLTTTGITSGPGITFNSTVDSSSVSIKTKKGPVVFSAHNALTISDSGETTFDGAVGGKFALGSLTVTAPAIDIKTGSITTTGFRTATGDQTYNGPVTLSADATLTTNSAVDGITFNGTVDSDGTTVVGLPTVVTSDLDTLTINDSATTTFDDAVGGIYALGSLDVTAKAIDIKGGAVTTTGNTTPTGDQTYNGPVTLGANTTLTTNTAVDGVTFNGTVNSSSVTLKTKRGPVAVSADNTLTISDSATTTFGDAVGGRFALGSLDVTADAIDINGGSVTTTGSTTIPTTGDQTYNGPVTLGANTTLTTNSAVDGITFNGTVDSADAPVPVTSDLYTLTINDSATTTFKYAVGSILALGGLDVTADAIDINGGSVTTTGARRISGDQTYNGPVTLGANTTLTTNKAADGITFNGTVDSNGTTVVGLPTVVTSDLYTLTIDDSATTTFDDAVGGTYALGSLDVTAKAIDINGGSVTTTGNTTPTGDQTYNGPVTLGANTTLTTNTAVDGITFNGTVNSNSVTTRTRKGFVTTSADNTLTIADSATTTFDDAVGGKFALGSLDVTANAIDINGGAVTTAASKTTTGEQTYNGPVTLGANTTLTTTGIKSGDGITFNGTVDSADLPAVSDLYTLTISDSGETTFEDAVGGTFALGSLTVTAPTIDINGGSVTTTASATIPTTGEQTYNGSVILSANTTLTTTGITSGPGITFNGTVDSSATTTTPALPALPVTTDDLNTLTISDSGETTFEGAVGGTEALGQLTVTAPTIDINGGAVTTTASTTPLTNGEQNYNGSVTLSANTTLTTTGITSGDGITFNGTVDSSATTTTPALPALPVTTDDLNTLTISDSGETTFEDAVGGTEALGELTVTAPTIDINGGAVTTTASTTPLTNGEQTYNGSVVLSANAGLTTTGITSGDGITFNGTINSTSVTTKPKHGPSMVVSTDNSLTISDSGITTFNDAVGGTFALGGLTTDATKNGATDIEADITTKNGQTYNNPVILTNDIVLNGSGIDFENTVDSDTTSRNLTINDAGTTTLNGAIGSNAALNNLTINTGNTLTIPDSINVLETVVLNPSKGGVNETTGTITVPNLLLTGSGTFNLNNTGNDVDTIAAKITGSLTFNDGTNTLTVGTVSPVSGITTNNGNATLTAGTIDLTQNINTSILGSVTLDATSGGVDQTSGAITGLGLLLEGNGTFSLNDAGNNVQDLAANIAGDLVYQNSGVLFVGKVPVIGAGISGITTDNGNVTLNVGSLLTLTNNITAGTGTVTLDTTSGGVLEVGGNVTAANLLLLGKGSYILTSGSNHVGTLAAFVNGLVDYTDSGALTVGSVTGTAVDGATPVTESGITTNNNTVTLSTGNTLTISQNVNAGTSTISLKTAAGGITESNKAVLESHGLLLTGTGTDTLTDANADGTIAASITGSLDYTDANALTVGTVLGTNGITTNNNAATLNTGNTLTIAKNISTGTGVITLNPTTGGVSQTSGVLTSTGGLLLTGAGTFTLNGSSNSVVNIAASINGILSYKNAGNLTINTVGGVNGITDTAALGVVTLTSTGSILNNGSSITANTINLNAAGNIGAGTGDVSTNPVVTDSSFLNVNSTEGNVYMNSTGVEINLDAPLGSVTMLTNDVILDTITTLGDFTLEATSGNITINGTTDSTAGAVNLDADHGNINANPGSVVDANANSFFSTPNGTIGVAAGPVNVDVIGNLILNIGTRIGLTSGILVGTVDAPPANIPLVLPSNFPSPLYPPGNIFFNGKRIWPSENEFAISQANSGLLSHFVFPSAQSLALTQVNTFDPSTSSAQSGGNGLFLYHPLTDVDSGSFDQEFQLDEGAYDFIDGDILKKGAH